jgi:hypothetical protein
MERLFDSSANLVILAELTRVRKRNLSILLSLTGLQKAKKSSGDGGSEGLLLSNGSVLRLAHP